MLRQAEQTKQWKSLSLFSKTGWKKQNNNKNDVTSGFPICVDLSCGHSLLVINNSVTH